MGDWPRLEVIGSDLRPISVTGHDLGLGLRSMGLMASMGLTALRGLMISMKELRGLGKSRDFGDGSLRNGFR